LRLLALLLVVPAVTLIASSASAQDIALAAKRPKVCLVLSGGGARGAAHVGVIKVLEELRVPVDCIAGTSIGALVGAAYASGSTVSDMEAVISGISAEALFIEKPPRQEQSIRRKEEDFTNLVGPELGFRDWELLWSKGFVSGVQLETILRKLAGAHGTIRIEELPIQYRAVATDLETGKPVVFREGELLNAMRASMSVPAAIAPAEIDGRLLVDGGLTDNLPVDVARAMGADIVIAVNLGAPLFKRKALGSVLGVTGQMVNILTEQNVQVSLASLKSTDILIEPELEDFSFSDFGRLPAAVPVGEAAAHKVADRLLALAVTPTEFATWRRQQRTDVLPDTRAVDEIRLTGLQRVNPEFAASLIDTMVGEPIDTAVLDRDVQRLYGTGDFEHVTYRVLEEPGRRVLSVDTVENARGPNYLRFGLALSSDFRGDAYYNLLARYRRTWLNSLGAEWRTDLQIGHIDRIASEFYQPLDASHLLFVAPYAEIAQRPIDTFSAGHRIDRFDLRYGLAGVDVGSHVTKYGEARAGLLFERAHVGLDTGSALLSPPVSTFSQAAVRTRFLVDQVDSANFPRAGYAADLTVTNARRALGADASYSRWEGGATYFRSFGDHSFNAFYRGGGHLGGNKLPVYDLFQWGGLLQQSGYPTDALIGQSLSFGRLVYYNRLARQTLLEGFYAGLSLEAGRVRGPLVAGNPEGLLKSAALFLGFDSPLGPLYFAYGRTSDGLSSIYLFLGRP